MSGLSSYSLRLAAASLSHDVDRLRSLAAGAARLAVAETRLDGPVVEQALEALAARRYGASPEGDALADLVERLDDEAFALEEERDVAYFDAYRRARAATALLAALGGEPRIAARRAMVEAIAARDGDPSAVEAHVLDTGSSTARR